MTVWAVLTGWSFCVLATIGLALLLKRRRRNPGKLAQGAGSGENAGPNRSG